jgi:hypothetical protein
VLDSEPMTPKPRNPGGRPPLSREGSTVRSIRLSNALYDAVIVHAREQGIEKISDFIRDAIRPAC